MRQLISRLLLILLAGLLNVQGLRAETIVSRTFTVFNVKTDGQGAGTGFTTDKGDWNFSTSLTVSTTGGVNFTVPDGSSFDMTSASTGFYEIRKVKINARVKASDSFTPSVTFTVGDASVTLTNTTNTDLELKPTTCSLDGGAMTISVSGQGTVYLNSITVEWITPGNISYFTTSVDKVFGDAPFTNPLTFTGDGTVDYKSSNPAVATVDANGEVTILSTGDTEITATATDGPAYTYTTKTASYALHVATAPMTVTSAGYSGTYDGSAHGITVNAQAGATVKYGSEDGTYTLDASPEYTDAGTYLVYYQVTQTNYTPVTGSETVTITQADGTISYAIASIDKTFGDAPFTNALTLTGDGTVSYSSSTPTVATVDSNGEVTIVSAGDAEITATATDGTNYAYATPSATYALHVADATMTVTSAGYNGTYDGSAHGITVNAPAGATVKYGTEDGSYTLDASPEYTDAGTYLVYYQVTQTNYTPVTGSETVTITQADGTISYTVSTVNKSIFDAAFTNPFTLTGDGSVAYSSSDPAVASVDAANGDVTIVGLGTATITATVTDGKNYTYAPATASYTLNVTTAAMSVSSEGYTGTYDGWSHGITVTAPDGATVKFGTEYGSYTLDASPEYTDAGTYTVYYQVTQDNYTTVTGYEIVTIEKIPASISYAVTAVTKAFGEAPFTNPLTDTGDGDVRYYSSNRKVAKVESWSGEVTIVGTGETTITATATDGTNYTYDPSSASYTLSVTVVAMTVTSSGYSGAYDGAAHGITVSAPDGATVKYGTTEGKYDLDASPEYTEIGTYTVYYQVTQPNYTPYTGSETVTIFQAAGSISFATTAISKYYGEEVFTNELTVTGDGIVSYSSSDETVATVDAKTGEVTITGAGEATITATVTDGTNYTYASTTASFTLTVLSATIPVTSAGYSGIYDGSPHGITVSAPDEATVRYGTTEGVYDLDASPEYTNAGTYTVYYQVTQPYHTTVTGSETVTITPLAGSLTYVTTIISKTLGDAPFTNGLTLTGDGSVSYSSSKKDVATVDAAGEVTIVGIGETTITATVTDGTNYTYATTTASFTLTVTAMAPIVNDDTEAEMTYETTFSDNEEVQTAELTNIVIGNILYTLNDQQSGDSDDDGYDSNTGMMVLNSVVSDDDISKATTLEPGTEDYAETFKGLTLIVPQGFGEIEISSYQEMGHALCVKIGDNDPVILSHDEILTDVIPYAVSQATYVYIYHTLLSSPANVRHRAKKTHVSTGLNGVKIHAQQIDAEPAGAAMPKTMTADYLAELERNMDGGIVIEDNNIVDLDEDLFVAMMKDGGAEIPYIDLRQTNITGMTVDRTRGAFRNVPVSTFIYMPTGNKTVASNVVIGSVCEDLQLWDDSKSDYHPLFNFKANTATYLHTVRAGAYSTIYLPFAIDDPTSYGTFYELGGVENDTLNLQAVEKLEPNKPYLFRAGEKNVYLFMADCVTVEKAAKSTSASALQGTYETIAADASGRYYGLKLNSDASLRRAGGSATDFTFTRLKAGETITPFSAYLIVNDGPESFILPRSEADTPTAIGSISAGKTTTADGWHTLSGQKLEGRPVQKGMYILDGKIIVVK